MLKPAGRITHVVTDTVMMTPRHSEEERRLVTERIEGFPNVDVLFSDRVVEGGGKDAVFEQKKKYKLKSGKDVVADVYIPAFAVFDRAEFLRSTEGALAPNGRVAVNKETLMSDKLFNVYAVGGCADNGEMSSIPKIEAQAACVQPQPEPYMPHH
jgi:NADPH-dependent 2,4-dienoyl-CoA reductase/sulfur reductase-like enzyme